MREWENNEINSFKYLLFPKKLTKFSLQKKIIIFIFVIKTNFNPKTNTKIQIKNIYVMLVRVEEVHVLMYGRMGEMHILMYGRMGEVHVLMYGRMGEVHVLMYGRMGEMHVLMYGRMGEVHVLMYGRMGEVHVPMYGRIVKLTLRISSVYKI